MKHKGIIKFIAAVLVAIVLLEVLGLIFSPKYLKENQEGCIIAEFYREKTDLDVVFFGTSTSYCSIAPPYLWHKFGFTSYTRACDSETMWQTYYLLRDTVRHNKPDVVVCDMSAIKFGEGFVDEPANRKIMDGMKLSFDKFACVEASMHEDESLASYLFSIFRFHSRWDELTLDDLYYAFHKPEVTHDGYLLYYEKVAEEGDGHLDKEYMAIPDKTKDYLVRIIEYCEEEGITLMLVKSPTYGNWFESYDKEIGEIASAYGVEYTNFDYYKDDIGLERSEDYNDGHSHLNAYGAEKYCDYLGRHIKERVDIPDHGDDPAYGEVWDAKYARYADDILNRRQ